MNDSGFSKVECELIKKYLALNSRHLEISAENGGLFEVFSDEKEAQPEFFQKNLLKIKDCPEFSKDFMNFFASGEKLRVSFYFNGRGVFFESRISIFNNSFSLCFPKEFYNIDEGGQEKKSKFSATLFYEFESSKTKISSKNFLPLRCPVNDELIAKKSLDIKSSDKNSFDLKVRDWISDFLERTGDNYEIRAKTGNGLFLIPAASYLLESKREQIGAFQGRKKTPEVIYFDDERIVFACESENMILSKEKKYKIQLSFPLPRPIMARTVNLLCNVDFFLENPDTAKICAVASISEIKEEDKRFLAEVSKS